MAVCLYRITRKVLFLMTFIQTDVFKLLSYFPEKTKQKNVLTLLILLKKKLHMAKSKSDLMDSEWLHWSSEVKYLAQEYLSSGNEEKGKHVPYFHYPGFSCWSGIEQAKSLTLTPLSKPETSLLQTMSLAPTVSPLIVLF